jgi:Leucine-rich repeat (LRR) protein
MENQISEIRGLTKLVNLQELRLFKNNISEIHGIERLAGLKRLVLGCNQIKEIKNLERLVNLQRLNLLENQISEIKGLDWLGSLKELSLNHNKISEIHGLERLINLQELRLSENKIQERQGLDTLVNLKELDLTDNRIKKQTKIQKETGLKFETGYFEIDSHKIEWGKSLEDVRGILLDMEKISDNGDELEYRVSEILGFEANRAKISADIDTGVFTVVYDIAPLKNISEEKFYMAYINHLEHILGKPVKTEIEHEITLKKLPRLAPLYRQGKSICKAIWNIDDIEITLRVFGEPGHYLDYDEYHAADLEIERLGEQDYDEEEDE